MNGEGHGEGCRSFRGEPLSMAPGCLGAKGTSLSESIVLLRLLLGTAQVAVEALDSCQFGEEGTSVPQLGAPCSLLLTQPCAQVWSWLLLGSEG